MEIWKAVSGQPGYEVSSEGNIRSWRSRNGKGMSKVPHPLKPNKLKKGYLQVTFLSGSEATRKYRKIHQVVLEAFVGPRPEGMESCHDDGDVSNNKLSNLRWDTHANNMSDQDKHGTRLKGEQISLAVLIEAQAQEVVDAIPHWKFGMGRMFAKKFGVGDSAISAIKNGQTWSHLNANH